MCRKFPEHFSFEFKISRKIICLFLALTLVVQFGCHTTQVTQSLKPDEVQTIPPKILDLKVGQLVRIIYADDRAPIEGAVTSTSSEMIVIAHHMPGKFLTEDVSIPHEQIHRIDVLEKKFNVRRFIWIGACVFFLSVIVVGSIILHYPS